MVMHSRKNIRLTEIGGTTLSFWLFHQETEEVQLWFHPNMYEDKFVSSYDKSFPIHGPVNVSDPAYM